MRSCLLVGIKWSICMLKSHRSLFSRTGAGLCIYHLFVWSNWNFLHISQWITLPTQRVFLHPYQLIDFPRILCGTKSPQVSRTLLSILADLNSAVVWMVFILVLLSDSSCPFTNSLVIEPSVSIIIGITITFMFHSFFSSLARFRYLSLFSPFFSFTLWSIGTAKSKFLQILCYSFLSFDDPFVSQRVPENCVCFVLQDGL